MTDLFTYAEEQARARNTDPRTSHEAAASIRARESQRLVLEALTRIGPATDEAVYEVLADKPISPSRARTARHELNLLGHVVQAEGEGRTRSGRRALLWKAVA